MNIKKANKFLLLYLIYSVIIAPIIFKIISKNINDYVYIFILNSIILSFLPILFYFLVTKTSFKEVLLFKKLSRRNLFLVIAITIFVKPVLSFIALITSMFFPFVVSDTILEATRNSSFLGMFIAVGILPALFEEFLIRGIYLSGFKKVNLIQVCIINGIVFGIMHFNWEQFFYASFVGAILCFLVVLTGSIWAGVLSHFLINGGQVIMSFLQNQFYTQQQLQEPLLEQLRWTDILLVIPQTVISLFILIYFIKIFIKENITNFEIRKSQPKFKVDKFFIACTIFYFISMILF